MTQIAVRPYDPADREALVAGFGLAGCGAPGGEAWGQPRSRADVYLTPYLDLEPQSAFLVTADGRPAGHLVGCVDDAAFPARATGRGRPSAATTSTGARDRCGSSSGPGATPGGVEPVVRGTGGAAQLRALCFDRLLAVRSPGCYLHTSAENARGIAYFRRMGFTEHGPNPPVPGLRFEGRPMHQQTMVQSAAP